MNLLTADLSTIMTIYMRFVRSFSLILMQRPLLPLLGYPDVHSLAAVQILPQFLAYQEKSFLL